MAEPQLLVSTGDPQCDKIIQGVIGLFELTFPDRVRGYYLRGSRVSGTSIAGSDIDLFVIFKDRFATEEEYYRAHELNTYCVQISPILLECVLVGELGLRRSTYAALNLKLSTKLLFGEDIRPELPPFDPDSYVRSVVHTPSYSYLQPPQRKSAGHLTYPLQHIAPDDPFFGYTQGTIPAADGTDQASTKLLVSSVGWTATAIVALRTGEYVRDKTASADLYRTVVADEWTDLVVAVHDLCRCRWHYRIPDSEEDQRTLRDLCDRALPFENHYLTLYRQYQLDELASDDPERQQLATQRLSQIVFPDEEVESAVAAARNR